MIPATSPLAIAAARAHDGPARPTVETLDSMRARHRAACARARRAISFEAWLAIEVEFLAEIADEASE